MKILRKAGVGVSFPLGRVIRRQPPEPLDEITPGRATPGVTTGPREARGKRRSPGRGSALPGSSDSGRLSDMPVPSETEPGHAGLPLIDLAAARELFRTTEVTGLGAQGNDEIFDRWLGEFHDIAFYRNADRPLQARPVSASGGVPEWLDNTRVGQARLEAVYLNPSRPALPPEEEPVVVFAEDEDRMDEADEADEVDSGCCDGMPGLCWNCEPDKERYAKVGRGRYDTYDEEQEDDLWVVKLVNAYPGGMLEEPCFDLSDDLPPDFHAHSIQALTLLTEAARRRLDAERWDTFGPWRLNWVSCEGSVTRLRREGEDFDSLGDASDGEPVAVRHRASIVSGDSDTTLQILETGMGIRRIAYHEPVSGSRGESPGTDTDTLDGLRGLLAQANKQLSEAGYEMDGEWTVAWSRCRVELDD
ncbi:hypothetical protein [Streptomyces sp. NPDC002599]|uniref:hypothetical protein n=1 Tax=Streptomyces sp. NPDC002599 TaxID=3154421 RepID=UPI00331EC7B7